MANFSSFARQQKIGGAMGIEERAETWVRVDLFCDGVGDDGICLLGASGESARISDVAPTEDGVRKAILNAAIKARWRFDEKSQRWLCPECVGARDALEQTEDITITDCESPIPQRNRVFLEESSLKPGARWS
jgi:hypothetical protein